MDVGDLTLRSGSQRRRRFLTNGLVAFGRGTPAVAESGGLALLMQQDTQVQMRLGHRRLHADGLLAGSDGA